MRSTPFTQRLLAKELVALAPLTSRNPPNVEVPVEEVMVMGRAKVAAPLLLNASAAEVDVAVTEEVAM